MASKSYQHSYECLIHDGVLYSFSSFLEKEEFMKNLLLELMNNTISDKFYIEDKKESVLIKCIHLNGSYKTIEKEIETIETIYNEAKNTTN